jgi:carbamoyl-phosphate synthase large subunit
MTSTVNLLLLNAGRRCELIRSFKAAFNDLNVAGRLITTDITGIAPALYFGDRRYILPHSSHPQFIKHLCALCRREQVHLIIPLIDPDLPVLACHLPIIERAGTKVLVSNEATIEVCRDKEKTFQFLHQRAIPTPKVFTLEEARRKKFPLFIKRKNGSASVDAYKVNSARELEFFAQYVPDALIQEFVSGEEYTVDVFSDWSGKALLAVPRKRLKVRAGEVAVGRIERDIKVEALAKGVARKLQTIGPVNIQIIRTRKSAYVTEINPRFGGGCPLSIAAGAPFPQWTILMAMKRRFSSRLVRIQGGLTMMRFDDSLFYTTGQLVK